MPRYEYECENGHKAIITRTFGDTPGQEERCPYSSEGLPPVDGTVLPDSAEGFCPKPLKRIYSPFTFTMS